MNNYNWMPIGEALKAIHLDTYVWYRYRRWDKEISSLCSELRWLDHLKDEQSVVVCRALVPEVPSFEEQSK